MENTESFNKHRLNDKNKQEVIQVDVAKKTFKNEIPDLIVFGTKQGTSGTPKEYLTDREKQIMLTTLQWLGSHVGQSYLKECGLLTEFRY